MRTIGIIPARGGSKGIPRKNVRLLSGRPLIAWTIAQAKECRSLDRVIVSTDDSEIAYISVRCGADVPFMRPKVLAQDKTETMDVVLHALGWLRKRSEEYDVIVTLQPTSPLRLSGDIDAAVNMLKKKNANAVVSVTKAEHHPYWMNTIGPGGSMDNFVRKEAVNKNRQKLPVYYRINGAIYAARVDYLCSHRNYYGKNVYAYCMPKERSVDIDDAMDLSYAEYLIGRKRVGCAQIH